MSTLSFVRDEVLGPGLEAGEQILALGAVETFVGGTWLVWGTLAETAQRRLVPRWVALTTHRLLELEGEKVQAYGRIVAIRELRWAAMERVVTGGMGDRRGFDLGGPGGFYGFRFFAREVMHLDASSQQDFYERACGIVQERVTAARAAGPVTGQPALTTLSTTPMEEPGLGAAVAQAQQQSAASRLPVFVARGVAALFGLVGLGFVVIKLDHFPSGSFFRAACIGLVCLGIASAAGLWSVVRDRRAAAAASSAPR